MHSCCCRSQAAAAWDLAVMVGESCVPVTCVKGRMETHGPTMARCTVQSAPGVLHTPGQHTGVYTKKTVCMCARISPIGAMLL